MRHLENFFDGGCVIFAVSNIKDNISLVLLIISLLNICIKTILKIRKAVINKDINSLIDDLSNTADSIEKEVADYEKKKTQS